MNLRGHIRHGTLVFDVPPSLPDGTVVEVELRAIEPVEPTLHDCYEAIVGIADGLPADFSVNHDHYIHGTQKRSTT